MLEKYFPQGIAKKSAFIDREKELNWLSKNIESGYHTLLLAPRRYGKTSLTINALEKLNIPYIEINFYLVVSAASVEKKIIVGAQSLLRELVSKPEQILKNIQAFFSKSKKTWSIGFKGILGLEITPDNPSNTPDNILTILNLVEYVLEKKRKRAVFFFDEAQEIETLLEGKQIEGAIREFAQKSKWLTFIFSGSNRRMLLHMFDDRSMPLYELCDRILLERLPEKTYEAYLQNIAKKTLGYHLAKGVLTRIFEITECHPKRTYNLCFYLWRLHEGKKREINVSDVDNAWKIFISKRVKDVRYYLAKESVGQLKLLTLIAMGTSTQLSGQAVQSKLSLSSAAITKVLQVLKAQDYIEKTDKGYRVLDPLIRDILARYESENLA